MKNIIVKNDTCGMWDRDFFQKIDFCIGNLESPIIMRNKNYNKPRKTINLFSYETIEELIRAYNIKVVSLANNHIFDYGVEGFKDTIDFLNEIGVKYCGAGMDIEEAKSPCIIDIKGVKIAIYAFGWDLIQCKIADIKTPGIAPINKKMILKEISHIRDKVNFIILLLHWGYELEIYPLPAHRELAREFIEAGANLVIGTHPHIIQGFEKWKDGCIFYSLGNFFFPNITYNSRKVAFFEKIRSFALHPEGLLLTASIEESSNKIEKLDYFLTSNSIGHKEVNIVFREPDRDFKSYVEKLNYPLTLEKKEYIKFFSKNRLRRKGLPIFTGDRYDILKYIQLKIRDSLIKIIIRHKE